MIDPAGGDAEHRFLIAGDGVRLHCLHWRSRQSPPSAVLVFLHGIASHAGWFGETAADLNRQGVEVYGLDRRGSGRSGGARGHLDRYEQALDDVQQLVRGWSPPNIRRRRSSWPPPAGRPNSPWSTPPAGRRRCRACCCSARA